MNTLLIQHLCGVMLTLKAIPIDRRFDPSWVEPDYNWLVFAASPLNTTLRSKSQNKLAFSQYNRQVE